MKLKATEYLIDMNPQAAEIELILSYVQKAIVKGLKLKNVFYGYNLIPNSIIELGDNPLTDYLLIGNTNTAGFSKSDIQAMMHNYNSIFLCYFAIPVDEEDDLIENQDLDVNDVYNYLKINFIKDRLLPIGSISINNYSTCRTFKFLLGHIKNYHPTESSNNYELFMKACREGNMNGYNRYFNISYINKSNESGGTPLMQAAAFGNIEITKELVKATANLEEKSINLNTALMRAAYHGEYEVVELLLSHGANTHHINDSDFNVLDIVEERIADYSIPTKNGNAIEYEKIYSLLRKYFSPVGDIYRGTKDFQNMLNINPLIILKLEEMDSYGNLVKLPDEAKEDYIEKLKDYILISLSILSDLNEENITEEIKTHLSNLDCRLFVHGEESIYEEYIALRKKIAVSETKKISFTNFVRANHIYLTLLDDKLYRILEKYCGANDKQSMVNLLNNLCVDINNIQYLLGSSQPQLSYKTKLLFQEIIENLKSFHSNCLHKKNELKNILCLTNDLVKRTHYSDTELKRKNQKTMLIAKILDDRSINIAKLLSTILAEYMSEKDEELSVSIMKEVSQKYSLLTDDLVVRFCEIRIRHEIISNVAPLEIIVRMANFMEAFLYEYIYKPMKNELNNNFIQYFRQHNIDDSSGKTLGFYLTWLKRDRPNCSRICFSQNIHGLDIILNNLSDTIKGLNNIRKSIVHDKKENKYETTIKDTPATELASQSIVHTETIIKIFQDYAKLPPKK